jgi:tetratricopeptide (TPR) repeat protein
MTAGFSAAILGRFDEALRLTRRAVDLDPLNADSWERLGETELLVGQLDEAAAHGRKALELRCFPRPYRVRPNICTAGTAAGCIA